MSSLYTTKRSFFNASDRYPTHAIREIKREWAVNADWLIVERIFAQVTSISFLNRFLGKDLKLSRSTPCVAKLLGERCTNGWRCGSGRCLPPCADHTALITKDGKPHYLVTQPYGLSGDIIRQTVAWADEHGLDFSIDARGSWHFPSQTLLIVFWKRVATE